MRSIPFGRVRESLESASKAGRYNRGWEVIVKLPRKRTSTRLPIAAGVDDNVDVFRLPNCDTIVLVTNDRLDYCGIEVFGEEGDPVDDKFYQGQEAYSEVLGPVGLDLTSNTIASRLYNRMHKV